MDGSKRSCAIHPPICTIHCQRAPTPFLPPPRGLPSPSPRSWQRHLLELPSEWQASFVVPLYSDFVAPPDKADAFLSDLPCQMQRAQARLGAAGDSGDGGWAGGADPVAAAKQEKEQGNAEFRAGRFGVAANHYSEAVSALQREQPTLSAQQRQLLMDCLNNMAFALTKQADTQPAAAAELLQAAEAACTQALQADGVNSKALYRRAAVRQRQGRLEAAQADLQRIKGETQCLCDYFWLMLSDGDDTTPAHSRQQRHSG